MNKYLTKRKELGEVLAKEFNMPEYEIFRKLDLANELDFELENEEYDKYNLTDEQQEELIEIAYDFDMEQEASYGAFPIIRAVCKTLLGYETYVAFIQNYETKYNEVYNTISWCLD